MSSDDKKSIMAKINKWKNSEAKEDDFVQDIEDLYSGRTQEKVAEEGEEVTPEPLKQNQLLFKSRKSHRKMKI